MSYIDTVDATDVTTFDQLCDYAVQRYGVIVQKKKFRVMFDAFMKDNPHVTIPVLAKAIDWGKDAHWKLQYINGLFALAVRAYAAGGLPELDPRFAGEAQLETQINEALSVETDDGWRDRLICSSGPARIRALTEWKAERAVA